MKHEAKGNWAAWACRDADCHQWHCARCGEHTGGQGDTTDGFKYDGTWYPTRIYFCCDEEDTRAAVAEKYGDEPWFEDALQQQAALLRTFR